jgi:hypothetical protein
MSTSPRKPELVGTGGLGPKPEGPPNQLIGYGLFGPQVAAKDTNPKDAVGIRKVPFSVLPMNVLWHIGLAMLEGALKYGRHNYRAAGVRASVYFDATVARHIMPWWAGEDIDAESGRHHLDKAIASLMVLRDSMLQGNWIDDRPPRQPFNLAELNAEAGRLMDLHAEKNPHHYTIKDELGHHE